jgi:hypothetical protein
VRHRLCKTAVNVRVNIMWSLYPLSYLTQKVSKLNKIIWNLEFPSSYKLKDVLEVHPTPSE